MLTVVLSEEVTTTATPPPDAKKTARIEQLPLDAASSPTIQSL